MASSENATVDLRRYHRGTRIQADEPGNLRTALIAGRPAAQFGSPCGDIAGATLQPPDARNIVHHHPLLSYLSPEGVHPSGIEGTMALRQNHQIVETPTEA